MRRVLQGPTAPEDYKECFVGCGACFRDPRLRKSINTTKRSLQSALLDAARASGSHCSGRLSAALNALSRVLCWMRRVLEGPTAPEDYKECFVGRGACFRDPRLRKNINSTKCCFQTALLDTERASGSHGSENYKYH